MTLGSGERARRARGDAGVAMAEAALVTPVFVLVLFGVLEFGIAFRDYLTVNNAAQGGARAGAIAGNDPDADYRIVDAVRVEASATAPGQVVKVVIFKADGPNGSVPSQCLTSATGVTDLCNVYTIGPLSEADPYAWNDCSDVANPAHYWCPGTRKTAATASEGNGPPDHLGVWVEVDHPWITGLFGKGIQMESTAVAKLEPRAVA